MRVNDSNSESGDLVMSSTTDTPEQIREGLGLSAETSSDPLAVAKQRLAEAETAAVEAAAGAAPLDDKSDSGASPVVAEAAAAPATAKPAKKKNPVQPRIDELTRDVATAKGAQAVAEAERDALKKRLEDLTGEKPAATAAQASSAAPPDVVSPRLQEIAAERAKLVRPKQSDFEDFDTYLDARDEYTATKAALDAEEKIERKLAADQQSRVTDAATRAHAEAVATYIARRDAAKAKHADWDTVVTDGVQVSPVMQRVLLDPSNDLAGEMTYYLGQHPEDAARIRTLDDAARVQNRAPIEAFLAMGELRAKVLAESATASPSAPVGATATGPASPAPPVALAPSKPVSRAPAPPETVLGSGASSVSPDLEKVTDQREYNRIRDRQDQARRRR